MPEKQNTEYKTSWQGDMWDDVIEPRATIADIDLNTFSAFLEMSKAKGRLPDILGLSTLEIFEKLLLTENGFFKRAAIVLFASNPEKFYPSMFVKIGKWRDNNVLYHDVLEGNLFTLLRNGSNKINYDYTKRKIHFEGLYRVETAEYPEEAIREMLLNALVHRSYMGAPIQIRVYDEKINIWNEGSLPTGVSVESLKKPHSSRPRNPIIAGVCFKSGLVEAWGSGTLKIIDSCVKAGLPEPDLTEQDGGFLVTLYKSLLYLLEFDTQSLNERQVKAIAYLKNSKRITNREYQKLFNVARNTASRDLTDLKDKGFIKSSSAKGAGSYYEI